MPLCKLSRLLGVVWDRHTQKIPLPNFAPKTPKGHTGFLVDGLSDEPYPDRDGREGLFPVSSPMKSDTTYEGSTVHELVCIRGTVSLGSVVGSRVPNLWPGQTEPRHQKDIVSFYRRRLSEEQNS